MHYKQLDGLRFIAVISVILHHISPPLKSHNILDFGAFGVNLFFVISGFLITEILLKQKAKGIAASQILKAFFARRVVRIFPLYFLYIFICYMLVPQQTNEYIVWLLSYTINFCITIYNQLTFWYFTHLWSLSVEEQFYLFWPFLILFVPQKRLSIFFIFMIGLAIVIRIGATLSIPNYRLFNYTMLPTALDCFGAGALLAYLKTYSAKLLQKILRHSFFIPLAIVLYVLNNTHGSTLSQQALQRLFDAFIAFYLVGITSTRLFKGYIAYFLEHKAITYIGKISYGMYIYHLLIWGSFGPYFKQFASTLMPSLYNEHILIYRFSEFVFITICTIIVSTVSFQFFEKPILRLKKYMNYAPSN